MSFLHIHAGVCDILLFQVLLADLVSADDDRGQDYDGQVQVSEDRVALGDEDHDAELGDQGAGDEHHADEDGIAQGALLALLGLVVLAEASDAREGEADDRAEDGDEDDDYVHDGQPVVAEALEQGVERKVLTGDVVDVSVAEEHHAEDYEQNGVGQEAGDGGLLGLAAVGDVLGDGGDVGDDGGLEAAVDYGAPERAEPAAAARVGEVLSLVGDGTGEVAVAVHGEQHHDDEQDAHDYEHHVGRGRAHQLGAVCAQQHGADDDYRDAEPVVDAEVILKQDRHSVHAAAGRCEYRDEEGNVEEDDDIFVPEELDDPGLVVIRLIDAGKLHGAIESIAQKAHSNDRDEDAGQTKSDIVLIQLSAAGDAGAEMSTHPHCGHAYEYRQALFSFAFFHTRFPPN